MRTSTDDTFHFSAEVVKAEENEQGDWIFEAMASIPGIDLQGEEVDPMGIDTDFFFGKGLPEGAGGFIGYNHRPGVICGYPLEGKISPRGFWLKWKGLKTPFMHQQVEQMKALRDAGWPRRYGMSIDGLCTERDPTNRAIMRKVFIRNVDLTPTPVKPGTWVDFAKSLDAQTGVEFDPYYGQAQAIRDWVERAVAVRKGLMPQGEHFTPSGRFRRDRDIDYFEQVEGLPPAAALFAARYALSRQDAVMKALTPQTGAVLIPQSIGGSNAPADVARAAKAHLRRWKARHPRDPHLTRDGAIRGGLRAEAAHYLRCEGRKAQEVAAILRLVHEDPSAQGAL